MRLRRRMEFRVCERESVCESVQYRLSTFMFIHIPAFMCGCVDIHVCMYTYVRVCMCICIIICIQICDRSEIMEAVVRAPKGRKGDDHVPKAIDLLKLYNTTNDRTYLVQVSV